MHNWNIPSFIQGSRGALEHNIRIPPPFIQGSCDALEHNIRIPPSFRDHVMHWQAGAYSTYRTVLQLTLGIPPGRLLRDDVNGTVH